MYKDQSKQHNVHLYIPKKLYTQVKKLTDRSMTVTVVEALELWVYSNQKKETRNA